MLTLISGILVAGCAGNRVADENAYPYLEPLVAPGTLLNSLPFAVQHTVRAEAGTAEIYNVDVFPGFDREIYRIVFRNTALYPPLFVGWDGSVLYPNGQMALPFPRSPLSTAR
jgi:hypothetical protein